ncbi:YgaP family membrane protein [Nocardia sp. CA-120079]|uniref:YgaP family membrane protein n=1 Tax=Nocardia sp. CA-120079 TaxID=3239974 RepID=UPI003D961B5B
MPQLPRHHGWSIPRVVPLLAGAIVLMSAPLAAVFSQWWLILTGFVGANLLFYSAVGWCPATLLLQRAGVPGEPAGCSPATSSSAATPPPTTPSSPKP